MKIISYLSPIDGTCPVSQLRLANAWSRAWTKTGLEPFVATEWHIGSDALSKWLLEAFAAQERPTPVAVLMQIARATAPAVLRKGECAYIAHYDCLPAKEHGWHREESADLLTWWGNGEEILAFGTRSQLAEFVNPVPPVSGMLDIVHHLNTPELRAMICPKVSWPTDEPIEEPPTGQFGGQFRPRTRIPK